MVTYKIIALTLVMVIATMACVSVAWSQAGLIEDALKIFGISYVVRTFGGQINDFVNTLAGQQGVEWEGTTKVVPIISVGAGTYVGAAQVQGPPERVEQVRAVGQVETRIADVRGRMLLPINTTNPTQDLQQIRGVGVSAIIDFRL